MLTFALPSIFEIEVLVTCKSTKLPSPNSFTFRTAYVVLCQISDATNGVVQLHRIGIAIAGTCSFLLLHAPSSPDKSIHFPIGGRFPTQ